MADDDEDPTAAPPAAADDDPPAGDESAGLTLAGLDAKLDRLSERLTAWMRGGSRRPAAGDEAADVATQVRAELDRVNANTERQRRGSALQARIDKIEEQLKAAAEKPPVQHRKVELFMGWVDPQ